MNKDEAHVPGGARLHTLLYAEDDLVRLNRISGE